MGPEAVVHRHERQAPPAAGRDSSEGGSLSLQVHSRPSSCPLGLGSEPSKARPPAPHGPPPLCAQKLSPSACWESTRLREKLLVSTSPVAAPNCCLGGPQLHAGTSGRCPTRGLHVEDRQEHRACPGTVAQSRRCSVSSPNRPVLTPAPSRQAHGLGGLRTVVLDAARPMHVRTASLSSWTLTTVHASTHLGGWIAGPQGPPRASFILHSEGPSLPSQTQRLPVTCALPPQGLCVHLHSSLLTADATDSRGWGPRLQNLTSLTVSHTTGVAVRAPAARTDPARGRKGATARGPPVAVQGGEHHVRGVQGVDEVGREAILLLQCVGLSGGTGAEVRRPGLLPCPVLTQLPPIQAQHRPEHSLAGVPTVAEGEALDPTADLQGCGGKRPEA